MRAALLMLAALASLAGCNNADPVKSKTDTTNSEPVDKNPKTDTNTTPQTSTGGDQQGTQPTQPASPKPAGG
jgi:PBP1b-binding outer membrane lipoprotein LpoB